VELHLRSFRATIFGLQDDARSLIAAGGAVCAGLMKWLVGANCGAAGDAGRRTARATRDVPTTLVRNDLREMRGASVRLAVLSRQVVPGVR
jgi:hypothetical protein